MTQEQVQPEAAPPKEWWSSGTADRRPTQVTVPVVASRHRQNALLPAVMMLGGIATVVGSTLPWLSATILGHTTTVAGTNHGITTAISVNGWVTIAGGAAVALIAALMIVSGERALRWLAVVLSLATTGFAVYDIVRITQRIDDAKSRAARLRVPFVGSLLGHITVGYGLIMVVVAASVTCLAALLSSGSGDY